MEMYKLADLSTSHLTRKTLRELKTCGCGPYSASHEYGAFVHVPDTEEDSDPCPHDLFKVLAYARKNGVQWIKFDDDAGVDPELPVYDGNEIRVRAAIGEAKRALDKLADAIGLGCDPNTFEYVTTDGRDYDDFTLESIVNAREDLAHELEKKEVNDHE